MPDPVRMQLVEPSLVLQWPAPMEGQPKEGFRSGEFLRSVHRDDLRVVAAGVSAVVSDDAVRGQPHWEFLWVQASADAVPTHVNNTL